MTLDARTRNLLAAASRRDNTIVEISDEPITFSASGLARVHCVCCGAPDVNVHPRFIRAARCASCIRLGVEVPAPEPDDRPLVITFEELKAPYEPPKPPEPVKLPEPEWSTRSIGPIPPPPSTVTKLLEYGRAQGWQGEITYARGQAPKDRSVKDNFAVRLVKGEMRAVAVYSGAGWQSYWGVAHLLELPNAEEFKAYLRIAGTDLAEGFVKHVRAAAAVEAEKEVPVKCRDVLPHLTHRWENSKKSMKTCPGLPCDELGKHEPHEVKVKFGKGKEEREEVRACPGRERRGVAKKIKDDNGG